MTKNEAIGLLIKIRETLYEKGEIQVTPQVYDKFEQAIKTLSSKDVEGESK